MQATRMAFPQIFEAVYFSGRVVPRSTFLSMFQYQNIMKKGSCSDPSSYLPKTLTCILFKVFETLLNSHFLDRLEFHSLLSNFNHQYELQSQMSTDDILSYLKDLSSSAFWDTIGSFVCWFLTSKDFQASILCLSFSLLPF